MTIKTLPQWRNFAIGSREEVRQSQVSHDRVRYDLSKSCYANSRFQIENGERRYQREREKEREKIDEILFPFSVNLMNIFQILVRLVISLSLLSALAFCRWSMHQLFHLLNADTEVEWTQKYWKENSRNKTRKLGRSNLTGKIFSGIKTAKFPLL